MDTNVKQAVPFFMVKNIELSVEYYVDGLGFKVINKWIKDDKLQWCWLQLGGAAIMHQEFSPTRIPQIKTGEGVSVCFQCVDALTIYHDAIAKGITASEPFVGNNMWVTVMRDPDGYCLDFESLQMCRKKPSFLNGNFKNKIPL